ncbi:hypothetical protein IM538_13040 [Cytobacillus suaedae]|nr:hypothetical protein IM538_13040 [Cytobacillus suaedae]
MRYRDKLILFLSLILVLIGCSKGSNVEMNPVMPEDFEFSLTYGTYGKQKIDTFNDLVIKDLVVDGVIEAKITLSNEDMNKIYEGMRSINIMAELDLKRENECMSEPPTFTEWTIQMNSETKTIHYQTYCEYPTDILKLIELQEYIHNIVIEKPEYKELPASNGYYE